MRHQRRLVLYKDSAGSRSDRPASLQRLGGRNARSAGLLGRRLHQALRFFIPCYAPLDASTRRGVCCAALPVPSSCPALAGFVDLRHSHYNAVTAFPSPGRNLHDGSACLVPPSTFHPLLCEGGTAKG